MKHTGIGDEEIGRFKSRISNLPISNLLFLAYEPRQPLLLVWYTGGGGGSGAANEAGQSHQRQNVR